MRFDHMFPKLVLQEKSSLLPSVFMLKWWVKGL